jgi:hypothetical protein
MKKLNLYIQTILFLTLFSSSCRNEDLNPLPEPEWAPVATVMFTEDKSKAFYNFQDIDNAVFEYILDGEDFGYKEAEVASIDVFISHNGRDKQLYQNYAALPATVSVTAAQAAGLFSKTTADLKLGDWFTFSFTVRARDGRVFELYNNNICNLIRIEGVCSLDAYVLNPFVARTTVSATENAFKKSAIAAGTDTRYTFTLNKRDFIEAPNLSEVEVMLRRTPAGGAISQAVTLTSVAAFPGTVSITPEAAATALGINVSDIAVGDVFTVYFMMKTADGKSFTSYQSPNSLCGKNFSSNVIYPLHDPWPDRSATTAPPATPMAGTCSLSFSVVN